MEWINVKDRLPEFTPEQGDNKVITYSKGVIEIAYYMGNNEFQFDEGRPMFGVTNWMPLPEPPEQ